jgi:general secretion pathway protein L
MPGVIVGLDIGEEMIAGVRVKSGVKGLEIVGFSLAAYSREEGFKAGLERVSREMELSCDVSCVSLPPSLFSFRNLRLPFSETKKVKQTLGFELEPTAAIPINDLAWDFSIYDARDGSAILAAMIAGADLGGYLSELRPVGLDPETVTVGWLPVVSWMLRRRGLPDNGIFLEFGRSRTVLYLFLNRRPALIRELSFVREGEGIPERISEAVSETLHAFFHINGGGPPPEVMLVAGPGVSAGICEMAAAGMGIQCKTVDLFSEGAFRTARSRIQDASMLQGALGLALAAASRADVLNFRQGAFSRGREGSGILAKAARVGAWMIVPLLLASIDLWVEYGALKDRHHVLLESMKAVYRETFPDAKKVVDPLAQMKIALQEALKSGKGEMQGQDVPVVEILRELSARIPVSLDVRITRLTADHEMVRLTGRTDTFNTVNSIKDSLGPSGYFSSVTISSAVQDQSGKGVQFEMLLQRASR